MHIWEIKSVAEEINKGQLSEGAAFGYLFLTMALNSLAFFSSTFWGVATPLITVPFGYLPPMLDTVIVILGLLTIYRAFQRRHGQGFVQKFICLFLPANIRAFVFCLPLYIPAGIIAYQFAAVERRIVLALANAIIITLMIAVQFIIIYRNMLVVSAQQGTPTTPTG